MTDEVKPNPTKPYILGLGTARPPVDFPQTETAEMARGRCAFDDDQMDWLSARYARCRVKQRAFIFNRDHQPVPADRPLPRFGDFFPPATHPDDPGPGTDARMQLYKQEAPPLAADACHAALADADLTPADITHLVTVSCTGLVAPGIDILLMQRLGLPPSTARTMIGFMGCHGAFNGLRTAAAIAAADPAARVLVTCIELCSLHFQYGYNPGQIVANALFADGTAAAVVTADPALHQPHHWQIQHQISHIIPDSLDAMKWDVGDHGFKMTLEPEVPPLIYDHLPSLLSQWLATHELTRDDIAGWAIHPGGPKILTAIAAALELPQSAATDARHVLSEFGNMSSATVLFVIDRLRQNLKTRPCVAMSFGPGLTAELALFT